MSDTNEGLIGIAQKSGTLTSANDALISIAQIEVRFG